MRHLRFTLPLLLALLSACSPQADVTSTSPDASVVDTTAEETHDATLPPEDVSSDATTVPDDVMAADVDTDTGPPLPEETPEPTLDAIADWGDGKAYFFRGAEYIRFDLAEDAADADYPRDVSPLWPGIWAEGVDAAVSRGDGKAYFFRGSEVIRYDVSADTTDAGYPVAIATELPGVWAEGVDAALREERTLVLMRGAELLRFDLDSGAVLDGYPRSLAEEWSGTEHILRVDAAFISNGSGALYLFHGEHYTRIDRDTASADSGYPLEIRWYWPGLWDPFEGTGEPGERLPDAIAAQLAVRPSDAEITARRERVRQSVTADEVWYSDTYPQHLASIEDRLGVWGCGIIHRPATGAWRFRCATGAAGAVPLEMERLTIDHIDWRIASHHVDQVSQGDFSARRGTPVSIMHSDDGTFRVDSVNANSATGSISGGLNIKVTFMADGVERLIGFSHLSTRVPAYIIEAAQTGEALPVGTAFGFIGYTGNLWMAAPPDTDAPYSGSGAGLPVSHSHLWFKDSPENHTRLSVWARKAIEYTGTYRYGGG